MKNIFLFVFSIGFFSPMANSEENGCKMLEAKVSAQKILKTRDSQTFLGVQYAGMWISSSSAEGACILVTGKNNSKVLGGTEVSLGTLNTNNKNVLWINYKGQVTLVDSNTIPEAGVLQNLSCSN